MQAVWCLKTCPTTWDFAAFLVCAKTLGAEHVHFRYEGQIQTKKYPAEVAWARYMNILEPLCDLAGVTHSIGPGGEGLTPAYHYGTAQDLYRKKGGIWKFPKTQETGEYVTVTLRDSFRNQHRNSSKDWLPFIQSLMKKSEVVILPDCEADPIHVAERLRLYSGARINYSVNNGPNALLVFSESPYRIFKMIAPGDESMRLHLEKTGFPKGSQFEFRNESQRIVWDDDTLDVLMREAI